MASPPRDLHDNDELARAINEEARTNPDSPFAGKFVGIAHGKVVSVADDLDTVAEALEDVEPDRLQRFILEASADYDNPCEIWWN